MASADAVLLASGTATLEAMLLKRPMVVAYRMAAFSWFLISRMLTTKYVSLPNLLADRLLVPELLQKEATPQAMASALQTTLASAQARENLVAQYTDIHRGLALNFSERAAQAIDNLLREKTA